MLIGLGAKDLKRPFAHPCTQAALKQIITVSRTVTLFSAEQPPGSPGRKWQKQEEGAGPEGFPRYLVSLIDRRASCVNVEYIRSR